MNIRTANNADAETLALLSRVTYTESHGSYIENKTHLFNYENEAFSVAKITRELKDVNVIYDILYYNDFPVGYSKLILNATNKNVVSKKPCCLERIYVLSDFIHLKAGRLLMEKAIEKATQLSFDTLWLSVYKKNSRAIRFYEKNEFLNVGTVNFIVDGISYENKVFTKKITS